MPISILHVGLPLDHPLIPSQERPKITKRLADLQQRMRGAGYNYDIAYASPKNLLKNDSGYPMQPARTNQRRAKMACNAPIRPLYTFLVTFSESKVSA